MQAAKIPSAATRELADELETVLENWGGCIRGELASDVRWYPRDPGVHGRTMQALNSEALSLIPAVRASCRGASRKTLEALRAALRLGLVVGLSQMEPWAYHYARIEPDAARGQEVKRAASTGGKARAKDRDGKRRQKKEQAIAQVIQLHEANPYRSKWDICEQVGKALGRDRRTIQRYTAGISFKPTAAPRRS